MLSGTTEGLSVVEESLVSVSLGGGGLEDTGLGTNALLELRDFGLKSLELSLLSGDGGFESGLVSGVLGN